MNKTKTTKCKSKYKLGIAFSGGGARGIAHVGAIKALEEAGISFDYVSGTSAGSLIGALYAYGLSAAEMEEIVKTLDAKEIAKSFIRLPNPTSGIEDIIKNSIGDVHFDELKLPFIAVTTDLISAKEIRIGTGNVAKACAASCAVPGIFKYVEMNGYHLQDGGLLNNIPSDVARTMGAEKVLAIDINSTRGSGTESTRLINIITTSLGIAMRGNSEKGYKNADVVVQVPLKEFSSFKLENYEQMIERAYNETKKKIPEIKLMLGIKEQNNENIFTKLFKFKKTEKKTLNDEDESEINTL